MICDLAVHRPDPKEGQDPNPHFHVMATMRPLNPDGSWGEKQRREYVLDENGERVPGGKGGYVFNAVHTTDWHTPETLEAWREAWCRMVNEAFERKGIGTRIDHRSYAEQGVEQIPTIHEGPMMRAMEEQGMNNPAACFPDNLQVHVSQWWMSEAAQLPVVKSDRFLATRVL